MLFFFKNKIKSAYSLSFFFFPSIPETALLPTFFQASPNSEQYVPEETQHRYFCSHAVKNN